MNENKIDNEKKFCEDCGFEWEIHFLRKRKDGKYFCIHCAPRNQLRKGN
ncbi:MAG: hypothetical protein MRECE_25c012 [Mycoplasmataceae bacterium CE_OT135]|nr:MAG: hypothetical protein MRECE_25c012 [Mycoplasmataceae bacterium CE_OT135]